MKPYPRCLGVGPALALAAAAAVAFSMTSDSATAAGPGSVCARATEVATWSPDGKRIAYVGRLHAICVASADGAHLRPLPYTVCRGRCLRHLPDPPLQLDWVRPKLLLYLADFQLFEVRMGQRPRLLGTVQGGIDTFAVDARGHRVALGSSVCSNCRGPVTVLSLPAGRIVGQIGGPGADNDLPSLSPDGRRLAFVAFAATTPAVVWIASADGSGLQPLLQCGGTPVWSPRGDEILCSGLPVQPPRRCCSLSLVSPQGGPSSPLVPRGVAPHILAWSPDGKRVVFLTGRCTCRLAVVDVRTRKQSLVRTAGVPLSADWSPDSRQLLVAALSPAVSNCALLWRVPADSRRPRLIRNCS